MGIPIGNSNFPGSSCRTANSIRAKILVYCFWEDDQQMAWKLSVDVNDTLRAKAKVKRGMPRAGSIPQLWTWIHSKALKQTNTGKTKKRQERPIWGLWGTMLPSWLLVSFSWRTSVLDDQGTSETPSASGFHVHCCMLAQEKQGNKEWTRQM